VNRIAESIGNWRTAGRNYHQGVHLLKEHAPSKINRVFALTIEIPSPKNKERVNNLLFELEQQQLRASAPQVETEQSSSPDSHSQYPRLPVKQLPKEVQMLHKRREEIYTNYKFLKNQFLELPEKQRNGVAEKIMELWFEKNAYWRCIDHYHNTGAVLKLKKMDFKSVRQRIRNLDSYISKANKTGDLERVEKLKKERESLENMLEYE